MNRDNRRLDLALLAGALALLVLPWYRVRCGVLRLRLDCRAAGQARSLARARAGGDRALAVVAGARLARRRGAGPAADARPAAAVGFWFWRGGRAGLAAAPRGCRSGCAGGTGPCCRTGFGKVAGQPAFGAGAVVLALVFTLFTAFGLAERGALKGDAFVLAAIATLILLVTTFVFYPILSMFTGAFQDFDGILHRRRGDQERRRREDLVAGLPDRRLLRDSLADLLSCGLHRFGLHGAGAVLRAGRHAHPLPVQEVAAGC